MKRKELKNFAKRIAQAERTIKSSNDPLEIRSAQEEVIKISELIESLEDMEFVDEQVQELLQNC